MPAPLTILIVHNDYQQRGGETAAVDAETALLEEHGHRVVPYRRANDEIERYDFVDKAMFPLRTLYSQRTYREIRKVVETERPDVAHVHNVFPLISPSAYSALKDAGVPMVQTIHNYRLMCPNALFYTHGEICERCMHGNTLHAVRWRCYRDSYALSALYGATVAGHRQAGTFGLVDRFVVPAEFTAAKLVNSGVVPRDRVTVLGYFLPDPLPRPGSFDRRPLSFLYIGRLSEEKGVWTLIEAMRGLPHICLKVCGSGPLEQSIRDYVNRERLSNVEMAGFVSGEAKWDALRSALAVVVPSKWFDVSPLSVVEALTAGTAVVAPDLGNFPRAVEHHETGVLFRPGDSADLRDKLGWVAEHPELAWAMGRRARAVAETRYSAGAHYEHLLRTYRALLPPVQESTAG